MEKKFTNRLINESSPYLLQHAHNPVEWYPWGEEAFEKARREDKLLIISIGYSACHWCHVMEHESFEDEQVAGYMNKHFVSVKVDREERPDVDQFYMDAANLMQGRGGWPLNAITLPDLRPVYAATYFPKERWLGLLENLHNGYTHTRDKYLEYADKLVKGIAGLSLFDANKEKPEFDKEQLKTIFQVFQHQYDRTNGGNGRAPKFPMPDIYLFLLRYQYLNKDDEAMHQVLFTLDKMAKGGIYDQLGGGFARYSVDAAWHVPHFEKMLYDNGQLISLYSEAFHASGDALYSKVVYETIDWAQKELLAPEGGFYSALDADSEGEEGKFYVWGEEEFDNILGENAALVKEHFGIGKEAFWEHGNNVLVLAKKTEELAATHSLPISQVESTIASAKEKLLEARNLRIHPGLDDKILFSWNALMLKGLVDAYNVFREERFLNMAAKLSDFMDSKMTDGLQVYRSYKNGKASIPAFLEDYALYIQALISYYQISFEEKHLQKALELTEHVIQQFYDKDKGYFYFTAENNTEVLSRKIDVSDNVIASPNSVMAHNLFYLGLYYDKSEYSEMAKKMLSGVMSQLLQYGPWHAKWASLLLNHLYPFYEVAVSGADAVEQRNKLEAITYVPNKLYAGATSVSKLPLLEYKESPGKTLIYVCENKTCQKPTESPEEAFSMLRV